MVIFLFLSSDLSFHENVVFYAIKVMGAHTKFVRKQIEDAYSRITNSKKGGTMCSYQKWQKRN